MNPIMKENQILRMISDASSLKKNDHQSLYWIEFHRKCSKIFHMEIPDKYETYEGLMDMSMEEVCDKVLEVLFDLSIHHYISNVKRIGCTLRINFKECLGGRKPNFGVRTVKKVVKIMENAGLQKSKRSEVNT